MAITTLRYSETPSHDFRGGIVCIGNFDGVHRGHAALLKEARQVADGQKAPVIAMTFDPHPMALLTPERYQPPLTTVQDRARLLHTIGADHVVILQTTPELLALSPHYFFETIIAQALQAKGMVEGFNFRFGHHREGSNDLLRQLCEANKMAFREVSAFALNGQVVSSSRVRDALNDGNPPQAHDLLNRHYRIRGIVGTGAKRGRTIGFPTANLELIATLLPVDGVYAVKAVHSGGTHTGAANIGPNPTFGEGARKIEVHLLDFSGDLYGQTIEVAFLERLRATQPFPNVDALLKQLQHDVAEARRIGALHTLDNRG
jgi:riboflavin kinase/FMN adenylyltransferase